MEEDQNNFGKRLQTLRKKAGYTQASLGKEVGASRRTISYYENEATFPPSHLIEKLAQVFGLNTDDLLGYGEHELTPITPKKSKLAKKIIELEKLPYKDRKFLMDIIDVYLEKDKRSKLEE